MAEKFMLMTEDNCDLPQEFYGQNNIAVLKMCYIIDEVTYYRGDKSNSEFYDLVRTGKLPTTAAANAEEIKAVIEPYLKNGEDVLYLAFSSGLSTTAQNGQIAAGELAEKYPGRKVICVDSMCASLGQGLFVYLANKMRQNGASIEEVAGWAKDNRLKLAHLVMADDLMHLHRGGRVSKMSAIAGGMLGIKPIIHMNDHGKLIPINKIRGKKQALTHLVDSLEKAVGSGKPDFFMVSHADCLEDAEFVAGLMTERFLIKDYLIDYIGPVIGAHTGPGTVAAFILAGYR
jgi:DegV family protein with EDD domain